MELLQVGRGSVFEHAITLERGLTIVKSLCHLPTRHIALFQYNQLLCSPHPLPDVWSPPRRTPPVREGVLGVLQSSTLSAMGGCDFVGFNHTWVRLKNVPSSHTHTCLVFAQDFCNCTLAPEL